MTSVLGQTTPHTDQSSRLGWIYVDRALLYFNGDECDDMLAILASAGFVAVEMNDNIRTRSTHVLARAPFFHLTNDNDTAPEYTVTVTKIMHPWSLRFDFAAEGLPSSSVLFTGDEVKLFRTDDLSAATPQAIAPLFETRRRIRLSTT